MRYLVLDIETLPVENAAEFIQTDDIAAPSNYKDPEKIAAYCAEARQSRLAAAALDLDLARVCAVGLMYPASPVPYQVTCQDEESERLVLGDLAERLEAKRELITIVTFSGHRYDLPLLMRRAKYLGIGFPRLNLDRFKSPHVDLYEELTMRGAIKAHGLRWYMRRHGWTDLLDADPLKDGGADVAKAAADGRWEDIAAHVRVDVLGTYRLAVWLGVIPKEAVAF